MSIALPVKLITSSKMKLLFAGVICLGVFVTAAISRNIEGFRAKQEGYVDLNKGSVASVFQDVADLKTLKQVHVIFRHGDRTPIDRFPKDPYNSRKYWPEGFGQLTREGKLMQYKLGKYIRNRYDGFLSKVFTPEAIYVQSSDKDRTIMSAMANLAALFPPTSDNDNFPEGARQQYVPIHTIPTPNDNKLQFSKSCPRYAQLFPKGVLELPSEKNFNEENAALYKFLSEHTGNNVTNYLNVSDIYDTLFVQTCHKLELPAWTKEVFPDKLKPMVNHWIRVQTLTEEMKILRAGPLLTEIVRDMKRVTEHPSEEALVILEALFHTPATPFYAYSGHDTTLSVLLDALGLLKEVPPYASSLYFELHEDTTDKSKYAVRIFYRSGIEKSAEELHVSGCQSSPCLFDDFMKFLENYMIDENQWAKQCQAKF